MGTSEFGIVLNYLFFYGSYLVFPFILLLLFLFLKKWQRWLMVFLFLISLLFVYSRFIETQLIEVNEVDLELGNSGENLKIALIADLHLGVYKQSSFLERVVDKINQEDVDIVMIAGDFTYDPDLETLDEIFEPLEKINAPVYAVTGNHDDEYPGYVIVEQVTDAVSSHDVRVIDDRLLSFDNLKLIGLSDLWGGEPEYGLLASVEEEDNVIVIAHNPDTIYEIKNPEKIDLMLSGHTHGGQIRLPFIYKSVIPTENEFDKGLYEINDAAVFVTSGLGEVGLPMRLFVPPEIVVIDLEF
ncbi:phosphohydrolase [Candidatus Peregrinibacteria bacterium]|nr:phosphohydrolase [Candidatus Peregrinibacteria bacterium]